MGLFGPSKKELAERAERERVIREQTERQAREQSERDRRERQEMLREENAPIWAALLQATGGGYFVPEGLLRAVNDWETWSPDLVLSWLRDHHKYIHLARAFEACGRFAEALALIETLGPASYFEDIRNDGTPVRSGEYVNRGGFSVPLDWSSRTQTEAYERKVAQLRGHCAAAKPNAHKAPESELREIEERYAYGEVSKAEYERLKAQIVIADSMHCSRCDTSVETSHKFCPRCGAQLDAPGVSPTSRQISRIRPPTCDVPPPIGLQKCAPSDDNLHQYLWIVVELNTKRLENPSADDLRRFAGEFVADACKHSPGDWWLTLSRRDESLLQVGIMQPGQFQAIDLAGIESNPSRLCPENVDDIYGLLVSFAEAKQKRA